MPGIGVEGGPRLDPAGGAEEAPRGVGASSTSGAAEGREGGCLCRLEDESVDAGEVLRRLVDRRGVDALGRYDAAVIPLDVSESHLSVPFLARPASPLLALREL